MLAVFGGRGTPVGGRRATKEPAGSRGGNVHARRRLLAMLSPPAAAEPTSATAVIVRRRTASGQGEMVTGAGSGVGRARHGGGGP